MAARNADKPRTSGRASIPTPPVKFALDDRYSQGKRAVVTKPRPKSKRSGGFSGWLFWFGTRVTIFYLIYAALWTCPSRPFAFDYSAKDPRPVCRNLAQAHDQLVPIVKPYWNLAQQKVQPYSDPVVRAVAPWATRLQKVSRPVYREANKRGRLIWKKRIDPARRRAIKDINKRIDPYVQQARTYHKKNVQPRIDTVHRAVKPYHDIYQRDVSPYVDRAYQYSLHSSSVSYAFYMDKVHPRVVTGLKQIYSFLVNHVDPAIRRFYSLYVRPQLERLLAKVYERKAHYLGSDAIKTAQKDMKHAAHEADKHAQQAVRKAEQEAIKAQNDPSLLDRAKQAKDAVVGGNTHGETDPVKVAQLDAELDAEEDRVKELLEVWETRMSDLIEKEYKLAVDRIADLRNRRLADLPDRFGLVNEAFVEDTVALLLNRVERGARKISNGSGDVASKVEAGNRLVDQQLTRFDEAAQDTKSQIAAFYEELLQQETQAIDTSSAEVRRFASAAKEAYDAVMRDAKFAVTMDEWQGWDVGVRKRATLFAEELAAVQRGTKRVSTASGAVDLSKEAPDVQKEINALRAWTDKLHGAARRELLAYGDSALAQLAGGGVVAKISDASSSVASAVGTPSPASAYEAASSAVVDAANGAASSARAAASSASGAVGGAVSQASVAASRVSRSAASAVGASPTPESVGDYIDAVTAAAGSAVDSAASGAAAVSSGASSLASQVSRSVASAAGASTPESVADYVEAARDHVVAAGGKVAAAAQGGMSSAASVADAATSSASVVYASGSSLASAASRSAASAVGASPSPETLQDRVDDARDGVNSVVDAASSSAGVVFASAASAAQAGVSSASSLASAASRSAASAVGASPSPETLQDRVDDARDGVNSVVDAASSSAGVVYASAASAAQAGVSSASSLASAASRSAASAVGASPTAETLADYIDDASDAAGKMANKAHGAVSKAAAQVHVEL
ncbi:hypothetical protein PANT_27c00019 [Moesziomyces antarcticus T-34]|uniref:Uncharacterized protein n=1 Tax=Pseudozyma antarctica (strain T-34) TaxID=1151754 RepID=M9MH36_PSEA3|nr:hypothetical protein PANT_27c00019 [Moesziomyces antarcticus T-34]